MRGDVCGGVRGDLRGNVRGDMRGDVRGEGSTSGVRSGRDGGDANALCGVIRLINVNLVLCCCHRPSIQLFRYEQMLIIGVNCAPCNGEVDTIDVGSAIFDPDCIWSLPSEVTVA